MAPIFPVEVGVASVMKQVRLGAGLVAALAVGCGGGTVASSEEGAETSGGEAASYEGPIASTDTERGAERFETFCGGCHPDGQEDVGPSLIAETHSAARIRQQVREGSAQMRPFPATRLSDTDLEAVLAYMATLGAVQGVTAAPAAPAGDVAPAAE